jgi:hypothetical protein
VEVVTAEKVGVVDEVEEVVKVEEVVEEDLSKISRTAKSSCRTRTRKSHRCILC